MTEYIVLCGQFYGNPEHGYELLYNFDGEWFRSRKAAIRHGLKVRGSDDFNIGVVKRGKLISIDWMTEVVDSDETTLANVQEQIGYRPPGW